MGKILRTRPTQKQIAEKLGLSAATVSLALRDNPVVAKATRDLVQQAMQEAGYVRNIAAASLRTGRSNIIGVSLDTVTHGFFADMLVAIERALEPSGAVILINNHEGDVEKLDRFISTLATYGADALMVSPPPETTVPAMERAEKHGMPVLYLGQQVEGAGAADLVAMDDYAAGRMAADHLLAMGYGRLCLVGASCTKARVAGFRAALEQAGVSWEQALWVPCDDPVVGLNAVLAREGDERPTGIICADDLTSRAACATLRAAGIEPGAEIGLAGIGSERGREFTVPLLTMVCGDTQALGRLGAETILSRLENPDAPPCRIILDPKLMPGETSGGPRG